MALNVQYRFKDDSEDQYHTCVMTHRQYENFKILPVVEKCVILEMNVKTSEENFQKLEDAMIMAIHLDR